MTEWVKALYIGDHQALDLPKNLFPFPRTGHLEISLGPTQFLHSKCHGLLKLIFHTNQYNAVQDQDQHQHQNHHHHQYLIDLSALLLCVKINTLPALFKLTVGDRRRETDLMVKFWGANLSRKIV